MWQRGRSNYALIHTGRVAHVTYVGPLRPCWCGSDPHRDQHRLSLCGRHVEVSDDRRVDPRAEMVRICGNCAKQVCARRKLAQGEFERTERELDRQAAEVAFWVLVECVAEERA